MRMSTHMKSSHNDPRSLELESTDHYQWGVVAALLIFGIVAFGLRFSFSVFFKSLQTEFGWNRANTSMVFSVYMLLSAVLVIAWGWAFDRYGAKKVFLLAGFFYFVLGLVLIVGLKAIAAPTPPVGWINVQPQLAFSTALGSFSIRALMVWSILQRPEIPPP